MTTSVTSLERANIYLNQSENELCKLQMLFDFFSTFIRRRYIKIPDEDDIVKHFLH